MRFIESRYEPNELVTATPARRIGSYLIEWGLGLTGVLPYAFLDLAPAALIAGPVVLANFTWFIVAARKGQTPGKQLLHIYILRGDGTRAGGWHVIFREFVVIGLLFGLTAWLVELLLSPPTLRVGSETRFTLLSVSTLLMLGALLWLLLDRDRQALWDKVARTYVAYSPHGYRPQTAKERRRMATSSVPTRLAKMRSRAR